MASENSRTEVVLENDARLIRAVGSIVGHLADRLHMPADAAKKLMEAAEDACSAAFPLIGNHNATLKVEILDYPDRIEVTLVHSGKAAPAEQGKPPYAGKIDRILHESREGLSRTTLVKFVSKPPASS